MSGISVHAFVCGSVDTIIAADNILRRRKNEKFLGCALLWLVFGRSFSITIIFLLLEKQLLLVSFFHSIPRLIYSLTFDRAAARTPFRRVWDFFFILFFIYALFSFSFFDFGSSKLPARPSSASMSSTYTRWVIARIFNSHGPFCSGFICSSPLHIVMQSSYRLRRYNDIAWQNGSISVWHNENTQRK